MVSNLLNNIIIQTKINLQSCRKITGREGIREMLKRDRLMKEEMREEIKGVIGEITGGTIREINTGVSKELIIGLIEEEKGEESQKITTGAVGDHTLDRDQDLTKEGGGVDPPLRDPIIGRGLRLTPKGMMTGEIGAVQAHMIAIKGVGMNVEIMINQGTRSIGKGSRMFIRISSNERRWLTRIIKKSFGMASNG